MDSYLAQLNVENASSPALTDCLQSVAQGQLQNHHQLSDAELNKLILEKFTPLVNTGPYSERAKARRAVLAYLLGGKCSKCERKIPNYFKLRSWEFDHIRELQDNDESVKKKKPFRISGNDCGRRSWNAVHKHCMEACQLLCFQCHKTKTTYVSREFRRRGRQSTGERLAETATELLTWNDVGVWQ